MMLELAEGDISHPVLPILRILDGHVRCDEMLHWLIKNRISGRDVALMVRFQFEMSPLNFMKWLISQIDHHREMKPILVGRDYKP